ncbi:MAG: hypothetical protein M3N18_10595 [Actinomycetota bacterium]|nr:hypothetical protein [Actinomycetota bacterium]
MRQDLAQRRGHSPRAALQQHYAGTAPEVLASLKPEEQVVARLDGGVKLTGDLGYAYRMSCRVHPMVVR